METILITGASRGIGLACARHFAEAGWRVFATCRHPMEAQSLRALVEDHEPVSLHRLDVTSSEDLRALAWELENQPVDVLLNNAGIYLDKQAHDFGNLRPEDWLRTFETNTLGPMRVSEILLDNVYAGSRRRIVTLSSHMGSIGDIDMPGDYYYRSSKAALNAAMHGLSNLLTKRGIGVQLLHPGGVATRMGPREGRSTDDTARAIHRRIDDFDMRQSGKLYHVDGQELPW